MSRVQILCLQRRTVVRTAKCLGIHRNDTMSMGLCVIVPARVHLRVYSCVWVNSHGTDCDQPRTKSSV